jgi:hypothetical protein
VTASATPGSPTAAAAAAAAAVDEYEEDEPADLDYAETVLAF